MNVATDEYRAEVEGGFTRVQKLTASDSKPYFLATDKTGTTFYFGQAANTRIADPNDATKIFRWCLDRVEDPHGNYMTISYTGDQGQGYLARIDYTGHGTTAPTNRVIFHLEDRTDAVPMYTSHFLMKTAKRLKTIEVQANGNLIRAYKLTYTSSAGTSRSLLSQVQQVGSDATVDATGTVTGGSRTPAVQMHYGGEDSAGGWRSVSAFTPPYHIVADSYTGGAARDMGSRFVDLNGDGRLDFVVNRWLSSSGSGIARAYLNTGTGWVSAPAFTPPYHIVADSYTGGAARDMGSRFVDLNGDGRLDFVVNRWLSSSGSGIARAYLNTGTGWVSAPAFTPPYHIVADSYTGGAARDMGSRFVDLNGDGRLDFVVNRWLSSSGSGIARAYLNTGTGWVSAPAFTPPYHIVADSYTGGGSTGHGVTVCGPEWGWAPGFRR